MNGYEEALKLLMIPGTILFVLGGWLSFKKWREDRRSGTHHPAE